MQTNVLAYIEVYLSCHTNPANLLINSDIAGLLVRAATDTMPAQID